MALILHDNVQYQILQNYKWNSYGGGTNFIIIPGASPVLLEGNFAYSQYQVTLQQQNTSPSSSSISGFSGGFHFTYFFGKNALKYGIDLSGYKTNLTFYNTVNRATLRWIRALPIHLFMYCTNGWLENLFLNPGSVCNIMPHWVQLLLNRVCLLNTMSATDSG
jgi:hypothetical protein